jgi:site-specific recombinase XerD
MKAVINKGQDNEIINPKLAEYARQATLFYDNSKSQNTKRAYKTDIDNYIAFCESMNLEYMPGSVKTIALYISYMSADYKVSTIKRRLSAVSSYHLERNLSNPVAAEPIKILLKGLKREKGVAADQKNPLLTNDLAKIIYSMPDTLKATRDKAILLIGFAGAFRRSELSSLNIEDVEFVESGAIINLRRSKTDQEGRGQKKAISCGTNPDTCPVNALKNWIESAGIKTGALFVSMDRHGNLKQRITSQSIALIIKKYAKLVGYDIKDFSGHSLRAGFATQASKNGASDHKIKEHGGWKSSVYHQYIRSGELFHNNASAMLGL